MLCLKKIFWKQELIQLAIILSLLKVNHDSYSEYDILDLVSDFDLNNGTSWRSFTPALLRSHYVHPKSLDSVLLNYERELFADLNSLGRFNGEDFKRHSNVTAYLLNIERTSGAPVVVQEPPVQNIPTVPSEPVEEESLSLPTIQNEDLPEGFNDLELTQEDMDLIEVLWKQDVDLGFSLDPVNNREEPEKVEHNKNENATSSADKEPNETEKRKASDAAGSGGDEGDSQPADQPPQAIADAWAGVNYTIDTETGEYVILDEPCPTNPGPDCGPSGTLPLGELPLSEFLLDDAFNLAALNDSSFQPLVNPKELQIFPSDNTQPLNSAKPSTSGSKESTSETKNTEEELDLFSDMIQTSQFHPHHRAYQNRMSFVRAVSMEQRWQDLASSLSLPSPVDGSAMPHIFGPHHSLHNYGHHAHGMGYSPEAARGVLIHNATLTPPMGDLNGTVTYNNLGGTNLGNAVATSMNLTNSSEPMGEPSTSAHYKVEPTHDMMYYQNSTDFNQTDGLLSQFLNDEDLQLMDLAMTDGMYTMRMLDVNNTLNNLTMTGTAPLTRSEMERVDTSSDSAVSSMGSERVPSLSDGEWCDAGSDSGHTAGDHYVTDYQTKYRPYDYSCTNRQPHGISGSDTARLPVAQKKHQMFGKRYFQEQGSMASVPHPTHPPLKYEYRDSQPSTPYSNPSQAEGAMSPGKPMELKYSCSMEFGRQSQLARSPMDHIQHNHTYHLPAESAGAMQRPITRDKAKSRKNDDEHLTRDEKRARALNVPITVDDIINLPMDEFNERLSKYDLSEAQLSLIRDIRRRGKNKVAAQNCRKRKLDQITSLADEVKEMKDRKLRLVNEHEYVTNELKRMKDKYQQLYRHIFQHLRDPDGNPYSPYHYSLQSSADGSILLVPRSNNQEHKDPPQDHKNG